MAVIDDADKSWEYYGKHDPYYGVLTAQQYRAENMTEEAKEAFFETGRKYIDDVFVTVRRHLDPHFNPQRALDFGCGVGRLVIPLASVCKDVTGVDVSDSMILEAQKNINQQGLTNISLVKSDDTLSRVTGQFDFINSYLVFQHIPPRRGEQIFQQLISRLKDGGVGVVHVTYRRKSSLVRRFVHWARAAVPLFNGFVNLFVLKKPFGYPMMQMNEYKLERLFSLLQDNNCFQSYVIFNKQSADATSTYSVAIYFQKGT